MPIAAVSTAGSNPYSMPDPMVNDIPRHDLKNFQCNPIIRAANRGHESIVRVLIECGADINIHIPEATYATFLIAAAAGNP